MLTTAGSTAAPGAYGTLGVIAADQYGSQTGSVYDLVAQARRVDLPGNYGDEVNRPMEDGRLSNAATGLVITPYGTGPQLRGTVHRASMPAGVAYTWTEYTHLPR